MARKTVTERLRELRRDRVVSTKTLAARVGKTRQNIDAAFRGESNLLLGDAEAIADELGAQLEVVIRRDPVDDFRRALEANRDISDEWRDTIWSAFEKAKAQSLRGNPRSRRARGDPARERSRAAASE